MLKEGPAEDFANREKVAALFRFASTAGEGDKQTVSLSDYIGRMPEGQDKIYYIIADSHKAAANSPHLEIFRKKGVEVLLLSDRIDEWMMGYLSEYDGKQFQNVIKGDLDLSALSKEADVEKEEDVEKESEDLLKRVKSALENSVSEVKVSSRLTDSPACLVLGAHDMGAQMRQIMEAAGQHVPDTKPVLEVNLSHTLVEKLNAEIQEDRFNELAMVIFDQARLAQGEQLDDPAGYVNRINKLLLELAG